MQSNTVTGRPSRDTAWKRDGKAKGIYWRKRADSSKAWGYYAWGKINAASTRQDAIDAKAKATVRKSDGLPAPNTQLRIRDLADHVREIRRQRLRNSSFAAFEYALDKVILPELGHLKPAQVGPDRVARLIHDLEKRGLKPATIRRYLEPLTAICKVAVRRGAIPVSPLNLLTAEERPRGGTAREHYIWSPDEIAALIAAAHDLGRRPEARCNYGPILQLLALTGLRISEALALRWNDVDLLEGALHVRASLGRDGKINHPKTEAGTRTVPLSPGLVDLLANHKPNHANDDAFIFASKSGGPLSYWNVRERGFVKALQTAGLAGRGIRLHDLRSAAASILVAQGLSPVDVASVLGHRDPNITLRVYAKLFAPRDVAARVRAAQATIPT